MVEQVRCSEKNRIDKVLNQHLPCSRSQIQRWIADEKVTIDGEVIESKSRMVQPGTTVTVEESLEESPVKLPPEDKSLEVLHEDQGLLVINKQSGIVVHPTPRSNRGTLANRLIYHYPELEGIGESHRPGIVHRLDRGTSGVLLVARTQTVFNGLKEQFRNRTLDKTYCAVLTGELEEGTVRLEVPIKRHPKRFDLRAVDSTGRYAETTVEKVASDGEITSVFCYPKTGRTHQIRVHAQYMNHPLVGDDKYGGTTAERLMLHARSIQFLHPSRDEILEFSAPIPEEVERLWTELE